MKNVYIYLYCRLENATRYCHSNSTWDNYTNYDQCQHIVTDLSKGVNDFEPNIELPTFIYGSGYILSLTALCLALGVFIYFK